MMGPDVEFPGDCPVRDALRWAFENEPGFEPLDLRAFGWAEVEIEAALELVRDRVLEWPR